jgi:hypothetical protein
MSQTSTPTVTPTITPTPTVTPTSTRFRYDIGDESVNYTA